MAWRTPAYVSVVFVLGIWSNPASQRLASIPGIGPIIATALAATVVEPIGFASGQEFAAWPLLRGDRPDRRASTDGARQCVFYPRANGQRFRSCQQ
jgi:transposase